MSKTAILRTRVDAKRKVGAEKILSQLGLSVADGINIFLSQICIQQSIPFVLTTRSHLDLSNASMNEIEDRYADRIPNKVTKKALAEKPKQHFKTATEVLKKLKS